MDIKTVYLGVAVILVLSVVPIIKGDVDCDQRPNFVHPKECCPVPNLISEEVIDKCLEQLGLPPAPPEGMSEDEDSRPPGPPGRHHGPHGHHGHHGRHNHCLHSCFLNETGIMVDGQLDEDNLENYLIDAVGDTPDIIPVFKESFVVCHEKTEELMQKMREHFEKEGNGPPRHGRGPPHGRCPPNGGILFHCAMMKTFKECPDSIWTGTDECNDVRDYFTECMSPPEDDE